MEESSGGDHSQKLDSSSPSRLFNKTMPSKEEQLNDKHRIGFLNQCKLELSAEVIRWKAESLRLQKENKAAVKQIEELQMFANKLARKNHELETSLFLSWEENKRLRVRTLAIGEENSALHERLSKTKYYSYPWIDLKGTVSSRVESTVETKSTSAIETWQDVSKKLFQQMQKEMVEMQKLSEALADHDKVINPTALKKPNSVPMKEDELYDDESYGDKVDVLSSEAKILKRRLKLQNEKLLFLLNNMPQDSNRKHSKILDIKPSTSISKSSFPNPEAPKVKEDGKNVVQPTDETFRAYFTQQLNKTGDEKKIPTLFDPEHLMLENSCSPKHTKQDNTWLFSVSTKKNAATKPVGEHSPRSEERKLCPICEVAFSKNVSDKEFEAHVMAHLEVAGETLLDQLV